MTGLYILCIVVFLLYIAVYTAYHYNRYGRGRNSEFLRECSTYMEPLIMLSFTWLVIGKFYQGHSPGGWIWALICLAGCVVMIVVQNLTRMVCQKIWPKNPDMEVVSVKMPKGLWIAVDIVYFITAAAFSAFLLYILIFGSGYKTGDIVLFVLCLALFGCGVVDSVRRLIKHIRKH